MSENRHPEQGLAGCQPRTGDYSDHDRRARRVRAQELGEESDSTLAFRGMSLYITVLV